MKVPPVVLSIAGFDPSSGAGVTADIKNAFAHGCYAVTCVTALTVQSTQGVFGVQSLEPGLVARTLQALADDVEFAAVRIGMLSSRAVATIVAEFLEARKPRNVVLDTVLRSSSGADLLDEAGIEVLRRRLLPLADVITPNIEEAAELTGGQTVTTTAAWDELLPQIRAMAARLHSLGARAVVITGGHLAEANDFLSYQVEGRMQEKVFPGQHIGSRSTHGTGCAFATALACGLAQGKRLPEAVGAAKDYVSKAIAAAYPAGKGTGPVNHAV
jgi:hydroxymethylpyrimidine/phosphomethylpyrimidine kinase